MLELPGDRDEGRFLHPVGRGVEHHARVGETSRELVTPAVVNAVPHSVTGETAVQKAAVPHGMLNPVGPS
jgi:hypothetical protein